MDVDAIDASARAAGRCIGRWSEARSVDGLSLINISRARRRRGSRAGSDDAANGVETRCVAVGGE